MRKTRRRGEVEEKGGENGMGGKERKEGRVVI